MTLLAGSADSSRVALGLVTALFGILLLGWVQLTPLYQAPDEPFHADLVLALAAGQGYPPPGALLVSGKVRTSLPMAGLAAADATDLATQRNPLPLPAAGPPARDMPYAALPLPQAPAGTVLRPMVNQMTQHPPLYYALMAGATSVLPGFDSWSFPVQLGAMRVLSALLVLPLPLLAHATARRLGADRPVALTAAVLTLGIPQLTHIGASVTNDALLVLLGAVLAAPLVGVARGDVSIRTAVFVGVLLGLALLTKAFAIGLVLWAGLAYLLALLGPARDRPVGAVLTGMLAAGLALAVGGWWFVVNLLRYGSVQPDGLAPLPARDFEPDLVEFTRVFVVAVTRSFWGSFGWLELHVAVGMRGAAAAVVLVGLVLVLSRRPALPWARAAAATAVVALCAQLAVIYQQSLKNYLLGEHFAGLQGRYMFAFVGVLAALVAVGLGSVLGSRARRWLPLASLAAVAAAQATGMLWALDGFWRPERGGPGTAVDVLLAWSPFSAGAARLTTGLAVLSLLATTASLTWVGVSGRQGKVPARHARSSRQPTARQAHSALGSGESV